MEIDIRTQDITQQLAILGPGRIPEIILKRDAGKEDRPAYSSGFAVNEPWWIIRSHLPQQVDQIDWSMDRKSPAIQIPMRRYDLKEQSAEVLTKFGMQLASTAMVVGKLKLGKDPRKMHITVSNVFDRADDKPGYSVYVGIAFLE